MKYSSNISSPYEIPMSQYGNFEVLLTVFGEFTVLRRDNDVIGIFKSDFRPFVTLFDLFHYFHSFSQVRI